MYEYQVYARCLQWIAYAARWGVQEKDISWSERVPWGRKSFDSRRGRRELRQGRREPERAPRRGYKTAPCRHRKSAMREIFLPGAESCRNLPHACGTSTL